MTHSEVQRLKLLIAGTCAYYQHPIEDHVLALYVEDLADLPFAAVAQAIKQVRLNPKTTRFPLPAMIRQQITPSESPEDQGRILSGKVVDAIRRLGWANESAARQSLGDRGWQLVELMGGWQFLCQSMTEDNITTYQAQLRDMASALDRTTPRTSSAPRIGHENGLLPLFKSADPEPPEAA